MFVRTRRGLIALTLGAVACAPILGLDDLHERADAVGTTDASTDSDADAGDASTAADSNIAPTGCTTHAQCRDEAKEPALCVEGKCVKVGFAKDNIGICFPQIFPNSSVLDDPGAVIFSTFAPVTGTIPVLELPNVRAARLALDEIEAAGGLPSSPPRHLGMVLCASDPTLFNESVRHVRDTLKLPAMMANFQSVDLNDIVPKNVEAGVFTLNPNDATETLQYANLNRLFWSLLGTPQDLAVAYRPLFADVYKEVKSKVGAIPKVALVFTNADYESALADVVKEGKVVFSSGLKDPMTAIEIEGKPPTHIDNANYFRSIRIESYENTASPSFVDALDALTTFKPDIIIALTTLETLELVRSFEERVGVVGDAGPANVADAGQVVALPHWILGPRSYSGLLAYLETSPFGETWAFRQKRFRGIGYASATDLTEKNDWLIRMGETHPTVDPNTYKNFENYYDAVYWLAYGLAAAGPGAPVQGTEFRNGVRNLLAGPDIIRPHDIANAKLRLGFPGVKDRVQFVGTLGPPNFDEASGVWRGTGSVYCFQQELNDKITLLLDTQRYSDGGLSGERCFVW